MLTETTDPAEMHKVFEESFATDPWYVHLYRTGHAYHGVHPFYMWYWCAHALAAPGPGHRRRRRPRGGPPAGLLPASTLADALEMASDVVGPSPTADPPARPADPDGRRPVRPVRHRAAGPVCAASAGCASRSAAPDLAGRASPRPAARAPRRARLRPRWSRRYPVRLARAMVLDNVTRPLAHLVAPTTVRGDGAPPPPGGPGDLRGQPRQPPRHPAAAHHPAGRFRHRTVVAAASDYFFDRRGRPSCGRSPWPPSRSSGPGSTAARPTLAAELLDDGWNLVIFPEGGRSPDGWAQPFRGGAAYLARRTGRPVVPVYLHGTRHVLPKQSRPTMRPGGSGTETQGRPAPSVPVTVVFGPPLTPDEGEDARRFGARIERAVAALADEVATDWWTARRRAADGDQPLAAGPDAAAWRRSWALDPPPVRRAADRRRAPARPTGTPAGRLAAAAVCGQPATAAGRPQPRPDARPAGPLLVRRRAGQRAARRAQPSSRSARAGLRASTGPWR